jgi:hypothetical protein
VKSVAVKKLGGKSTLENNFKNCICSSMQSGQDDAVPIIFAGKVWYTSGLGYCICFIELSP